MTQTLHGRIEGGRIVLDQPLALPDGVEVKVRVSYVREAPKKMTPQEFAALPFFGMDKGSEDPRDSVEIVNEMRAQWRQRPYRQD
jgi:hypothetical protein